MKRDHDRLGLYEALEISSDADQEVLRQAYRALIKRYHPDRNKTANAAARFQEVQQAYEVLGNADTRAQYDQWNREAPTDTQSVEEIFPLLSCEWCGRETPHLRIVLVHWIWSALFMTRHGHHPQLVCSGCGHHVLASATVRAGLLGWWGVPFGPLLTPVVLWKNLTGVAPREVNVPMLLHQAVAYAQRGNLAPAYAALSSAEGLVGSDQNLWKQVQDLRKYLPAEPDLPPLQDPWRSLNLGMLIRVSALMPAVFVVSMVASAIGRSAQESAAVFEACQQEKLEIESARSDLDRLSSKLSNDQLSLRSKSNDIELWRYSNNVEYFNYLVDQYNSDLRVLNSEIDYYNLKRDSFNNRVDKFNLECQK